MFQKSLLAGVLVAAGVMLLASCGGNSDDSAGIDLQPAQIVIPVSQIEVKGATDGIPAPDINPETLSKGYRYKPPGEYDPENPNKWQV